MGDADQSRITDPEASDVERARQLYHERGVVVGEYRDVVEDQADLEAEWAAVGEPLR